MKTCRDCIHYKPEPDNIDEDYGRCQFPVPVLPVWVVSGSPSNYVRETSAMFCSAYQEATP